MLAMEIMDEENIEKYWENNFKTFSTSEKTSITDCHSAMLVFYAICGSVMLPISIIVSTIKLIPILKPSANAVTSLMSLSSEAQSLYFWYACGY